MTLQEIASPLRPMSANASRRRAPPWQGFPARRRCRSDDVTLRPAPPRRRAATRMPALAGTVSGIAPARGADHRQAVGDRFGKSHAVAFESRRQHEQVGLGVEAREPLVATAPARSMRASRPDAGDLRPRRRRPSRARGRAVPRNDHAPRQIAQAWRAHPPGRHSPLRGTTAPTASSGAQPCAVAATRTTASIPGSATVARSARDTVIRRPAARGAERAGGDHMVSMGECRAFAVPVQRSRLGGRDAGFERERMMHQRDQRVRRRESGGYLAAARRGRARRHDMAPPRGGAASRSSAPGTSSCAGIGNPSPSIDDVRHAHPSALSASISRRS